jgi:uncharacterized protein
MLAAHMKIQLVEKEKKPALKAPAVVCGLPGSAFVGKFAVDHLIAELPASPLAEIYTDAFPPQITVNEDGSASLIRNDLYYWHGADKDVLLLTGDAQPSTSESEYELSEYIVDYAVRSFGAKELITLGAYVTGAFTSEKPKVYGAATDISLVTRLESLGCSIMRDGGITGMNGLLLGIAKLKGLEGYTLLGETSGYVFDPKASESVLTLLSKIVPVNVDMKKLEQRAKEAQEVLNAVERLRAQQEQQQDQQSQGPSGERKRLDYIS